MAAEQPSPINPIMGGAEPAIAEELSDDPVFQLEDQITVEQFSQLMRDFQKLGKHRLSQGTVKMSTNTFRALLSQTLNRSEKDERISLLCNKIDADGGGFIHKDEFSSYLLQQLREKDSLNSYHLPFQEPPKFRHNMASKEALCRLLFCSLPPRYITISKDGGVGVWNLNLHFQRGVKLEGGMDSITISRGNSTSTLWVTDCALLQDCNKLVLSTTSRELLFYDLSTFKCQYQVHDFPSVVLCMAYHSGSQSGGDSCLLYGDVSGSVSILTFFRPQNGLFVGSGKDDQTAPQMIAFSRLSEHAQYLTLLCMPQLHPDWVRRIRYVWQNSSFISCSNSPSNSLVMRDVGKKRKSYIFRIRKGVLCFDYSYQLEVLVTGSIDHQVRLWNPYVPSKPVAVLSAHSSAIRDVMVCSEAALIFSYSHDSLLCAWDLYEHVLVQKIHVRFPFSQRLLEYGPSVLNLSSHGSLSLVVICNEHIAELKMGTTRPGLSGKGGMSPTSHAHPITAAVYNPHIHQVVSGCEGGVVTVWDVDSGHQVLRLANCHDNNEITALNLDAIGRRLITGSRAGDIKVWNCSNGDCVKYIASNGYTEVTGVMHILERGKFLSVGWNKRITTFLDEPDIFEVKPDNCWKGSESHHRDDILCMSYCPPYYLATGSFDGEIKIWNLDTEKRVSQFHSMTKLKPPMLPKMRRASNSSQRALSRCSIRSSFNSFSSRPPSRRMSSYRQRANSAQLQHVPVNQVLFLRTRLRGHQKGLATLVSSEGGVARFWDIFSPSHNQEPSDCFSMTEGEEDECVMAMKTDPQDKYLLAGDTLGVISVFDIKDYCNSPHKEQSTSPKLVGRWQAHSGEIVSIDFIPHETQPLILSASADCTVRLWTFDGHYIGLFGQKHSWNLKNPSTFEYPNTPWGEVQRPSSHLLTSGMDAPATSQAAPNRATTPRPAASQGTIILSEEAVSTTDSTSETSLGNAEELPPTLTDKSLGYNYDDSIHRRMMDRLERRTQYSEVNTKATQRFGSICSPYQALQLLNLDDVKVPHEVASALHHAD